MTDAMRRRRGLGRGLAALLGDAAVLAATEEAERAAVAAPAAVSENSASAASAAGRNSDVLRLPITALQSGRMQPRRSFDETALAELAQSIRAHGLVQPILVRPRRDAATDGGASYEIVAGERRWRAAQRAQLHEVPVVVRSLDDADALQLGLIENVQRADLSATEEATAYRRLIDQFHHTQEDIAAALGKSRSHVANMLRLLDLPAPVLAHVDGGRLSAGHARALIGTPDPAVLAQHVIERGLSVREVEKLAARCKAALAAGWDGKGLPPAEPGAPSAARPATPAKSAARGKSADARALEQRIETALGIRVELRQGSGEASELVLQFRDFDQLDEAVRRLTRS